MHTAITKYTFKIVKKLISDISEKEKISVTYLKSSEGFGGFNYGETDGTQIFLSIFKKIPNAAECLLITFFHEFSHCRLRKQIPNNIKGKWSNNTTDFQYELWTSMLGIKYAQIKYNIIFSDIAVNWIINENMTYMKNYAKTLGH